jgi:GxxExxY protein
LALAKEFRLNKIRYKEQVRVDLLYKGEKIGRRIFDFVIDGRVVVELKVGSYLAKSEFDQINDYLRISGKKVGLLILFSNKGVKIRRVVNLK